jgi:hypothetical protein
MTDREPTTADRFLNQCGGLPFIDHGFVPMTLLTAVAAVRRKADPAAHPQLGDYLDPANAVAIFERHSRCPAIELEWTELSEDQVARTDKGIDEILAAAPDWRPLFDIPLRYRRWVGDGISSTSVLIPQTVYLGDRAFRSGIPLTETLVHEHAHVWLNFIAEVEDLQREGAPLDFVLASGTGERTLRNVLHAAHFAAAAVKHYLRSGPLDAHAEERKDYLVDYLGGCLDTSAGHPYLTPMGVRVWEGLRDFHASLVPVSAS